MLIFLSFTLIYSLGNLYLFFKVSDISGLTLVRKYFFRSVHTIYDIFPDIYTSIHPEGL